MRVCLYGFFLLFFIQARAEPINSRSRASAGGYSFVITNNSTNDKQVNLKGRQGFFNGMDDLLMFIGQQYSDSIYPGNYQKAWRFMVDFTWSAGAPLTDSVWFQQPLTFINSAGWGFCHNKAVVLAKIWMAMGYKARICYLSDHVVPEVEVKNHWEMWDPTFQVFYKDAENNVLGTKEIACKRDKSNIYDKRLPAHAWTRLMGYSRRTLDFYRNLSDSNYYKIIPDSVSNTNALFLIPEGGMICFPVYKKMPLIKKTTHKVSYQSDYAQMMLYIPKNWTGQIRYPLIFHGMESTGADVIIGRYRHQLNEKCNTLVKNTFESSTTLEILNNKKGIALYYLVNPRLCVSPDNFSSIRSDLVKDSISVYTTRLSIKEQPHIVNFDDIYKGAPAKQYVKLVSYLLRKYLI